MLKLRRRKSLVVLVMKVNVQLLRHDKTFIYFETRRAVHPQHKRIDVQTVLADFFRQTLFLSILIDTWLQAAKASAGVSHLKKQNQEDAVGCSTHRGLTPHEYTAVPRRSLRQTFTTSRVSPGCWAVSILKPWFYVRDVTYLFCRSRMRASSDYWTQQVSVLSVFVWRDINLSHWYLKGCRLWRDRWAGLLVSDLMTVIILHEKFVPCYHSLHSLHSIPNAGKELLQCSEK